MQQFELMALSAMTVLWVLAAVFVAWQMDQFVAEFPQCFGSLPVGGVDCPVIEERFGAWQSFANLLLQFAFGSPFFFGVLIGVPIVAREIEEQTAQLSWTVALSRLKWLVERTAPVLIVMTLMLAVIGIVAEALMKSFEQGLDPGFLLYDHRGIAIVVRGIAVFAVAALAGAIIGRTLPALILASALSALLIIGLRLAIDDVRSRQAVVITGQELLAEHERWFGGLDFGTAFIAPDGSIVTDYESVAIPEGSSAAFLVLPPEQFWSSVSVEIAFIAALALVTGGALVHVVNRRRSL